MSIAVDAVWEHGVLTPKTRLDLPEKTSVRITIDPPPSKLGEDLRAIRKRVEASGIPLLSKEEILQEIHERRGGYSEQDE
ncbi:MAG: antitoxin family protein [Opitutaceae bacterium]|nr:antitoxin family protein [Opitutaceae bacterium]